MNGGAFCDNGGRPRRLRGTSKLKIHTIVIRLEQLMDSDSELEDFVLPSSQGTDDKTKSNSPSGETTQETSHSSPIHTKPKIEEAHSEEAAEPEIASKVLSLLKEDEQTLDRLKGHWKPKDFKWSEYKTTAAGSGVLWPVALVPTHLLTEEWKKQIEVTGLSSEAYMSGLFVFPNKSNKTTGFSFGFTPGVFMMSDLESDLVPDNATWYKTLETNAEKLKKKNPPKKLSRLIKSYDQTLVFVRELYNIAVANEIRLKEEENTFGEEDKDEVEVCKIINRIRNETLPRDGLILILQKGDRIMIGSKVQISCITSISSGIVSLDSRPDHRGFSLNSDDVFAKLMVQDTVVMLDNEIQEKERYFTPLLSLSDFELIPSEEPKSDIENRAAETHNDIQSCMEGDAVSSSLPTQELKRKRDENIDENVSCI